MLRTVFSAAALLVFIAAIPAAAQRKEFRYNVAPGASVSLVNDFGPITLRASSGGQVIVAATTHSNKVEVDAGKNGNRVDIRTHFLEKASPAESNVDYDVQVPADVTLTVRAGSGPVQLQDLNGNLTVEGNTARVEVNNFNSGHLSVRTISGPIVLSNIHNAYVDANSVSGAVTLNNVSGKVVSANTTASPIHYTGDFGGGGEYSLTSHSGALDVALPAAASVDITARSVSGAVQNDFPLRPQAHPAFAAVQGRSFAGTANSGASSVRLQTFSGTIRVKKQ